MTRVHEIMTRSLASVSPDTLVKEVAEIMRDRNVGDVLVIEDGKLIGIVTDRDLATRALTDDADARQTTVRNYLTAHVVTGHPNWDLDHVAEVMAKHQIRRLPIVEDNQVVGIVSLGDVAIHGRKRQSAARSLAEISEPERVHSMKRLGSNGTLVGILAAAAAVMAWMSLTKSGQRIRKQVEKSGLPEAALGLKDSVQEKLGPESRRQAAELVEQSRRQASEVLEQLRLQLAELSARLPDARVKPKRKRFWFV